MRKYFYSSVSINSNYRRGYALLLTVVISGVILTLGLSAMNIIRKEIILTASARESQLAFYASDAGVECALMWDRVYPGFSQTVFATSTFSSPPGAGAGVECNGEDINPAGSVIFMNANSAITEFNLSFPNDTCTTVMVEKENDGRSTTVSGRGYNTCDTEHPRRVERALKVLY